MNHMPVGTKSSNRWARHGDEHPHAQKWELEQDENCICPMCSTRESAYRIASDEMAVFTDTNEGYWTVILPERLTGVSSLDLLKITDIERCVGAAPPSSRSTILVHRKKNPSASQGSQAIHSSQILGLRIAH